MSVKQRDTKGQFVKGCKGGPGRPKKDRVRSSEFRLIRLEPPYEADGLVWIDWIRDGKWWARECGDGVLEVQTNDPLRLSFIQFRVEGCPGDRRLVVAGLRVEQDLDFLIENQVEPEVDGDL